MVANRGEIAIRIFRAATELGLRTFALYTDEDRYSLHRYKADEAYRIGKPGEALKPYLDYEAIVQLALDKGVDAIHPGYGFLSENVAFARLCREKGIIFVGPSPEAMEALGNKILGKQAAERCKIPTVPGAELTLSDMPAALEEALKIGFPLMIKAASGGGGRGMRIVREESELQSSLEQAAAEAQNAFGDPTVFLERFIEDPKHIEVQIMADKYGNTVHLYERDCSVQRRYQKVVEVAPASGIYPDTKNKLYDYAVRLCQSVKYDNVGTVEFLVDKGENIYFIEVNPRVQVEHTITEEITKIDIVRSQILIAQGIPMSDPRIWIRGQQDVQARGYAIQCRITTEDPEHDFRPDTGKVIAYRNAAGFGIRLDEGNLYTGVEISPYFDSLLVKVSATGRTLQGTASRLSRALDEFRIRGVKTNIGFLKNVLANPVFVHGDATVNFIANNPSLMRMPKGRDRGTRLLDFLGHTIVNGNPDVSGAKRPARPLPAVVPDFPLGPPPAGYRDQLLKMGPQAFAEKLFQQKEVAITDTALRDAHQSLFATRMRTHDMLAIAPAYARLMPELFSLECWGGATFDVAMRFLHEDPWDRLSRLRVEAPNILFRMLLRGRNAVGYGFYSEKTVAGFIEEAAKQGVDIFRVFDSFNDTRSVADCVRMVLDSSNALAEAAVCYSGDMADKAEKKFTLDYYLKLAEPMVKAGAHMLCIKDMAGLIKPDAAFELVRGLRETYGLPVHLHTHDTSSVQNAALLAAIEAGVDGVDCAIASMSGLTSQPNLNALLALLSRSARKPNIDLHAANRISDYFEGVRSWYVPFEPDLKAGTAEVYENEIPGGQYSNLRSQARAVGLEDQFAQVRANYAGANRLLGRIVKVTPSSKSVGDMALFMTAHGLTEENFREKARGLAFPESVKSLVSGHIGTPAGGWPESIPELILDGHEPTAPAVAPEISEEAFKAKFPGTRTRTDYLSYLMYPKVWEEYDQFREKYEDVWYVPTLPFLYALQPGEDIVVTIAPGKDLLVRCLNVSDELDEQGQRTVTFELNGQMRTVVVPDEKAQAGGGIRHIRKAEAAGEIGAPMPGRIGKVMVAVGDAVEAGQPLFTLEAMKMESTITAQTAGTLKELGAVAGDKVEGRQWVLTIG